MCCVPIVSHHHRCGEMKNDGITVVNRTTGDDYRCIFDGHQPKAITDNCFIDIYYNFLPGIIRSMLTVVLANCKIGLLNSMIGPYLIHPDEICQDPLTPLLSFLSLQTGQTSPELQSRQLRYIWIGPLGCGILLVESNWILSWIAQNFCGLHSWDTN